VAAQARRSGWPVVAGVVLGTWFALYRFWQARVGPPILWSDSTAYAHSALWAGARPPLVPALWRLTGSPGTFVLAQTLVAIAAWCFLAWTVAELVRPGWWRVAAGAAMLGFALTAAITLWDRSVLSESLALSALAVLFATAIRVARRVTWGQVVAFACAAAAFALIRDSQIWMIVGLGAVIGLYAILHRSSARLVVLACLLLGVSIVALAGEAASHRNVVNVDDALFVRIFPYPDRVAWFADHGMPDAARVDRYAREARKHAGGAAPVVGIDGRDGTVQPLVHWLHTDATRVYFEWLAVHPDYVLTEPFRQPPRVYNDASGHIRFYAAPDRTDAPLVNTLFDPGPWWALVALMLAVVIGIRRQLWREHWWRMVAVLGVLGLGEMLVSWHGDGSEATRHGIIGSVAVRLAVVVLLVAGAGARAGRTPRDETGTIARRREQPETAPGYAPAVTSGLGGA
jgi:hypothetical protein